MTREEEEILRLDRHIRGAIATLDNKVCEACRALTSVGEPCEKHMFPFHELNRLTELALGLAKAYQAWTNANAWD